MVKRTVTECALRKVEPLRTAAVSRKEWATGSSAQTCRIMSGVDDHGREGHAKSMAPAALMLAGSERHPLKCRSPGFKTHLHTAFQSTCILKILSSK